MDRRRDGKRRPGGLEGAARGLLVGLVTAASLVAPVADATARHRIAVPVPRATPSFALEEAVPASVGTPAPSWTPAAATVTPWRRATLGAAYSGLYGGAAKVGARLGLEDRFMVRRLETAWLLDVFGHVYTVEHTARAFAALHRWAGHDPRSARVHGAWTAAFGSLLYMEIINGFMPNVRFDWLDPISNAAGATMASEGPALTARHPWLRRLTLELGYDDWSRLAEPDDQAGPLTRVWHDYPNQRWGIGVGIGPVERPWLRVFGTYGVTALEIEDMRQEWGLGVELKPHHWLAPWIERVPGGGTLLDWIAFVDRDVLLPGLYVHLATWESAPFSDRTPFRE